MAAILTYHHVARPPAVAAHRGLFVAPERFAAQMDYLKTRGFQIVSLNAVREDLLGTRPLPRRSVAVTFDDGSASVFANAWPALCERGFTATVFLVAGSLGETRDKPDWPEESARYLAPPEIAEMAQGGIEFGSHTLTHAHLARLPRDQCEHELRESKRIVEELLDRPAGWLSYPFGSFSGEVIRLAREAGYAGATSTIRDNRPTRKRLYYLPRVMVMHDAGDRHFAYYFSRWYHWLHAFKNRRRWAKCDRFAET